MIDGLIGGKLHGQPKERTSKTGSQFVTCRVRAAGGDGESVFINVIVFDAATCRALLALDDGDSVALAGTLTPGAWLDRDGNPRPSLDMTAHAALTAYHVTRKRTAVHDGQD
jgi:single-stranded DNA-binding protein